MEQAEEDEITSQSAENSDEDDITPSSDSEEEMSILDREEITALVEGETARMKQHITNEQSNLIESKINSMVNVIMMKVEILQK